MVAVGVGGILKSGRRWEKAGPISARPGCSSGFHSTRVGHGQRASVPVLWWRLDNQQRSFGSRRRGYRANHPAKQHHSARHTHSSSSTDQTGAMTGAGDANAFNDSFCTFLHHYLCTCAFSCSYYNSRKRSQEEEQRETFTAITRLSSLYSTSTTLPSFCSLFSSASPCLIAS